MVYVGNAPSTSFATVVKDSFSGDGSTVAFTLSKVATTNSVSVFVENVRQEPTTAYAVSGTTLTFTAAPVTSSGNNIYVLHMNPTTTTTHPSAQNLTAVDGTFTGNIDVDGTANLDAVDIDGAVDMASTLAVAGDVAIDTDTLFVDVSQDNVGINTNAVDSDVALEVNGNVAFKNGSNYSLYADVDGALTAYHNGTAALATASGGAVTVANGLTLTDGDVTVANGHGISFAATANVTGTGGETLDDYEEGTFSVAVATGGGSITINSSYNTLSYTKIGHLVVVTGGIRISSVSSPSGAIALTSVPFQPKSTSEDANHAVISVLHDSCSGLGDSDHVMVGQIVPGNSAIYIYTQEASGVSDAANHFIAGSLLRLNICYLTAS